MKRILLPAALLLAFTGSLAFAQQAPDQQAPAPIERHHGGPGHHDRDPHKAALHLGKKLGLTADQTAKLEPILVDRDQKMSALHSNTELTPKDRRMQMHAIQKDTRDQLATVLTPEQQEQMKSMHKGGHRGPHEPATPPPAA